MRLNSKIKRGLGSLNPVPERPSRANSRLKFLPLINLVLLRVTFWVIIVISLYFVSLHVFRQESRA